MSESTARERIGRHAFELRNASQFDEAVQYLRAEAQSARERADLESEAEALQWLSTAHWFAGDKTAGVSVAREALHICEQLSEAQAMQCALTLVSLLSNLDDGPAAEAEGLLKALEERIAASFPDSHHEEMRLQRLETYLRKSGRASEADDVVDEIKALRERGGGFEGTT